MNQDVYIAYAPSPVGRLTLASNGSHLTGLWIEGQKYFGTGLSKNVVEKDIPIFEETRQWLNSYFSKGQYCPLPPLAPRGTPFQKDVWNALLSIPYGKLTTYGSIARNLETRLGKSVSAQAVGGAVGHNPISILIPCHRVVGSNGSLTGYAGGIGKKLFLLNLEGADLNGLFIPKRGTAL